MKRGMYAAVVALALLGGIGCARAQDIRACDFEVKARCASGEARVTLDAGALKRLEVDVDWCGEKGAPGYSCSIDVTRGDKDSTWSDAGGATIIANPAPFNASAPDRVKVTVGEYVSIDFGETQSLGRCGAGAELPRAIVIPLKHGRCRVWLGE